MAPRHTSRRCFSEVIGVKPTSLICNKARIQKRQSTAALPRRGRDFASIFSLCVLEIAEMVCRGFLGRNFHKEAVPRFCVPRWRARVGFLLQPEVPRLPER